LVIGINLAVQIRARQGAAATPSLGSLEEGIWPLSLVDAAPTLCPSTERLYPGEQGSHAAVDCVDDRLSSPGGDHPRTTAQMFLPCSSVESNSVAEDRALDLLDVLIGRPAWHADAACREHPELSWFPELGKDARPAKRVCAGCLVREECRSWSVAQSPALAGVWGGLSAHERAAARRGRAA